VDALAFEHHLTSPQGHRHVPHGDFTITAAFAGGKISGTSAVNSYGGPYTTGTGNAIKEAKSAVVGVGFDKSDAILQLVFDGALLCTMAQNPYVMGYQGMLSAVSILQGGEIVGDKNYDTGVTVVDKAFIETNNLLAK